MSPNKIPRIPLLIAVLFLFILVIGMFADVLFTSKSIVLSDKEQDLARQGLHWRAFGFGELRRGNLPLWNPHQFSGVPFFGSFQSALLYPLNIIYLFLPLAKAVNIDFALNVFLAGLFALLWAYYRRLNPPACILVAVLYMFGPAYFLHIFSGHLTVISTAAWIPLILLVVDGIVDNPSPNWCLLGIFAVAMQILAGYPQYAFYTGVTALIYLALNLIGVNRRAKVVACFVSIYVGAALLTAVQVFAGLQAAGESVRGRGLPYVYASTFSFPPENLLTLIAPGFFGELVRFPYWGRWHFWETSLFVGIGGLFLAIYGAICGDRKLRRYSSIMIPVLLILALGSYTPLWKILYSFVPGFSSFRGMSKFVIPASAFMAMLCGVGFDHLIKSGRVRAGAVGAVLASAVVLAVLAFWIRQSSFLPKQVLLALKETGQSFLRQDLFESGDFIRNAGLHASHSLAVAAGLLALLAILIYLMRIHRTVAYCVAVLSVIEVVVFSGSHRPSFDLASIRDPADVFLASRTDDDYRIMRTRYPNRAMSTGADDIWGYDPLVIRRYAEFMAYTQGLNPNGITSDIVFRRTHPLFSMLRCRYVFLPNGGVLELKNPMPHVCLVKDWVIGKNRDEIFAAMEYGNFDPRRIVILESPPVPEPLNSSKKGEVRLVSETTDNLIVEVDTPSPSILLITDTYSKGWRARGLPGSAQQKYSIMPANYILQAIPLDAGHHRIYLEFLPSGFLIGKWISIVSLIFFLGAVLYAWKSRTAHIANR